VVTDPGRGSPRAVCGCSGGMADRGSESGCSGGGDDWETASGPEGPLAGGAPPPERGPGGGALEAP
jgi:hypothetical protein